MLDELKKTVDKLNTISETRRDKLDEIIKIIDETLHKDCNSIYLLIKDYLHNNKNRIIIESDCFNVAMLKVKQIDFNGNIIRLKTRYIDIFINIEEVINVIKNSYEIEIIMKKGFFKIHESIYSKGSNENE